MTARPREASAVLVCLALVALLTWWAPDQELSLEGPTVPTGEWATDHARGARVTKAQLATAATGTYGRALTVSSSELVLVVATVEIRAHDEVVGVPDLVFDSGGRRWTARDEFGSARPTLVQPGFATIGTLVFEVPVDAVADGRIAVPASHGLVVLPSRELRLDPELGGDDPVEAEVSIPVERTVVS